MPAGSDGLASEGGSVLTSILQQLDIIAILLRQGFNIQI